MFDKKVSAFFVILHFFSLTLAEEILRCSDHPLSVVDENGKNLTLENDDFYFKYNRSNLAVYRYQQTTSVNLILFHTEASFKVLTKNNRLLDLNNTDPFEIFGVANIANPMNYNEGLKDCVFYGADLKTGRIIFDSSSEVIKKCFVHQLCRTLGGIGEDDFARAKAMPRNFGPLSVSSAKITSISDDFIPSDPLEPGLEEKYEDSVDLLIRNTAKDFKESCDGTVSIDDKFYTVIYAYEGSFKGVDNMYRNGSIKAYGSYQMAEFTFQFEIPKGHLKFELLRTFGTMPFIGVLCGDVEAVNFRATVSMTFTENSCQADLIGVEPSSHGFQKTYFCQPNLALTKLWTKFYVNNNNAFVPVIFENIATRIEFAMARQLTDNCEQFRISKYHFD